MFNRGIQTWVLNFLKHLKEALDAQEQYDFDTSTVAVDVITPYIVVVVVEAMWGEINERIKDPQFALKPLEQSKEPPPRSSSK